jgi:hypothetical protein
MPSKETLRSPSGKTRLRREVSEKGFRSTFVCEDYLIQWPDWFLEKYKDYIWLNEANRLTDVLASRKEGKTYKVFKDLPPALSRSSALPISSRAPAG